MIRDAAMTRTRRDNEGNDPAHGADAHLGVVRPALDPLREQALVEAAKNGDESAVGALYRAYYNLIYRYVLFRLGTPAAAEDVTSQVFLAMVKGIRRFEWQGKPFLAWLYAIAQKQLAFYRRGAGRSLPAVELEAAADVIGDTAGPHATAEERERRVRLSEALNQLPDTQREVVLLRYVLSLSLTETAAATERSEGAVKQLQLRGLTALRGLLNGDRP
jgi:RNA polymerase sigma-70 factor, ECF subfamily